MSRGHGRIERAILDALPAWPRALTRTAIAKLAYGTDQPTRSQQVAVARAVRSLAAAGQVITYPRRDGQVTGRYTRRGYLVDILEGEVARPKPPEGSPELAAIKAAAELRLRRAPATR